MATDLDVDDQWLYGNSGDVASPVKTKGVAESGVIKENGNGERPHTPTLDDMETALGIPPSFPVVSKIISTAPDFQPKQPAVIDRDLLEDEEVEEGSGKEDGAGEPGDGGGDSESDDEDDVQITIGEITTVPGGYNRTPSYTRMAITAGGATVLPGAGKKVDVDVVPQIGGQSLMDFDTESTLDKPWRLPGSDITDYFNYGFSEETWKLYCDKQRKTRGEVNQLNKIAVRSLRPGPMFDPKLIPPMRPPLHMPGFPPLPNMPLPPFLPPGAGIHLDHEHAEGNKDSDNGNNRRSSTHGDNSSDGRATPGIDNPPTSNTKLPLLPPPSISSSVPSMPPRPLPPPFGMPPPGFSGMPQENIAAAMAAMFGGGIRPPDHMHNMPPPPPHLLPHFPPHGFHGPDSGIVPPFPGMPPHFPMPGGDHGPMLDERGMPLPPEMLMPGRLLGQGFPWDPSMGPPPPELLEAFAQHEHRASRSVSRSSSYSRSRSRSRSSSFEDRSRMSGRKRDSRRHHRHSRSRSRSHDRDRDRDKHRSSRHHRSGDHHRSDRHDRDRDRDRERERDKDRDRDRERESKKRREHRDDKPRHERSSRRHRSSSRSRDDERSSRKEKSKTDQEARESRSKSRTP